MTDTIKDQLIVTQSIKLMQLESSLAKHKDDVENAARGQNEYREILEKIGDAINFKGNYHNIVGIIKEQRWKLKIRRE